MATDLAIEHHKSIEQYARQVPHEVRIPPISAYVLYHIDVLEKAAEDQMTPDDLRAISDRHDEILQAFRGDSGGGQGRA